MILSVGRCVKFFLHLLRALSNRCFTCIFDYSFAIVLSFSLSDFSDFLIIVVVIKVYIVITLKYCTVHIITYALLLISNNT